MFGLDLQYNSLSGNICDVKSIWELQDLRFLTLFHNYYIKGSLSCFLPSKKLPLMTLQMSATGVEGSIPWTSLALYENLTYLQLNHCKLKGKKNSSLVNKLRCLQVLTVEGVDLGGSFLANIRQLKNLYSLDLSMCNLAGSIEDLYSLNNLEYLILESNRIHGELPFDLNATFRSLKVLQIGNNAITGTLPKAVYPLNLTFFDARHNYITGTVPASLLQCSKLKFLDLSNNQITSMTSEITSANMPFLEVLDFSHNLFWNLTTERLRQLFIEPIAHKKSPIFQFNFAYTGLTGELSQLLWFGFNHLVSMRLSKNNITGNIPKPQFAQSFMEVLDLTNNNITGDIPEEISLLRAIKVLNLQGNKWLLAKNITDPFPSIAELNYEVTQMDEDLHYQCPQIAIKPTNGVLYVDSTYYKKQLCRCSDGFFGQHGNCKSCEEYKYAKCPGKEAESLLYMYNNTYPAPHFRNMSSLIVCDSVYTNSFRCNPHGNCTCSLNKDGTTASCNETCLCTNNSYGRLCSRCREGYYRSGPNCHRCDETTYQKAALGGTIAGILVVLLVAWILNKLQNWSPSRRSCWTRKRLKRINLALFLFLTIGIVLFGALSVIPSSIVEVYCTFTLLTVFGRLKKIRSFAVTLVMYIQVLHSLHVTELHVDCQYCSFATALEKMKFLHAIHWIRNLLNFNFYGLSCTFRMLFTPIGRLVLLASVPIVGSVLGFLGRILNYAADVLLMNKQPVPVKNTRKKHLMELVKRKSKEQLLVFFTIFYYPVSNQVIRVLLPCEINPGTEDKYMQAYPWIKCSSTEHKTLVVLGALLTVAYIVLVPLVMAYLLKKRADATSVRQIRRRLCKSYLDVLLRFYKTPYQKYMAVVLMIRSLALAAIISSFPSPHHNIQAILFNLVMFGFTYFIATAKPFVSYTKRNLESWIDVLASLTIIITYNCMTSRDRLQTSEMSEIFVLVINFCFLISITCCTLIHLWKLRKEKLLKRNRYMMKNLE